MTVATPIVATRSIIERYREILLASHAAMTNATPKKMNVVARSATALLAVETSASSEIGKIAAMAAGK